MKTVHKYRLDATIRGEIEYDAAKPESYTAALATVAEKRQALITAGAEITKDDGAPKVVRE